MKLGFIILILLGLSARAYGHTNGQADPGELVTDGSSSPSSLTSATQSSPVQGPSASSGGAPINQTPDPTPTLSSPTAKKMDPRILKEMAAALGGRARTPKGYTITTQRTHGLKHSFVQTRGSGPAPSSVSLKLMNELEGALKKSP